MYRFFLDMYAFLMGYIKNYMECSGHPYLESTDSMIIIAVDFQLCEAAIT